MRLVLFCHSLLSDWNHGNAHFLRGVVTELLARGHEVHVYEPRNAWSVTNLVAEQGLAALDAARRAYPAIEPLRYELDSLDLGRVLAGVDLVLVHEWNEPELVRRLGAHRKTLEGSAGSYRLLFHDTHHRSVTAPDAMAAYDLSGYDGVLAFGRAIADVYRSRRWARRVWVWHEAADVRVFRPGPPESRGTAGDLVWIGNWGDDERTRELEEFLLRPARDLRLRATVYGVRYPDRALRALAAANVRYAGWLPNFRVPDVFAQYRVTLHVPRSPYATALPGVPTIRPFEALACAIPLLTAPWEDVEGLFAPGEDYLVARDGDEMTRSLRALLDDDKLAQSVASRGRSRILERHTCAHRVDELLRICTELGVPIGPGRPARVDPSRSHST